MALHGSIEVNHQRIGYWYAQRIETSQDGNHMLPPCPHKGCTSDSDHHWHDGSPDPLPCHVTLSTCQGIEPKHRCYSRPLRDTSSPAPLMLSLPTVAKLVEAAMAEGYAAGSAQPEPQEG